jgi:hypothetical protein
MDAINGALILTPAPAPAHTRAYLTEDEILKASLSKCKIVKCDVQHNGLAISTNKKKFRPILIDIWSTMPAEKIHEHAKYMNVRLSDEKGVDGYSFCSRINVSFQGGCAKRTFKEIINMVNVNNYTISISIKLETDRMIYFKNF